MAFTIRRGCLCSEPLSQWIPREPKRPAWLIAELRQAAADQLWDIVPDSEVERLRNTTIARSVVEDHRKVAFFGGVVIEAVDCGLSDEVKQRFRANVRGPMMGAIRFDISIARLISAIAGPKSAMMVGRFLEEKEHFRRYYASLFINCREKPLNSYLFSSRHVRAAYLLALSKNEISPLFSQEQDIADRWGNMTFMHSEYSRYVFALRTRFKLSSSDVAMQFFRSKITDQTPQYSVCLSLEYEKLQDWLNKTVYNAKYGPVSLRSKIASNVDLGAEEPSVSGFELENLDPIGPARSSSTSKRESFFLRVSRMLVLRLPLRILLPLSAWTMHVDDSATSIAPSEAVNPGYAMNPPPAKVPRTGGASEARRFFTDSVVRSDISDLSESRG